MSKFQVIIICEIETDTPEDAMSLAHQVCDEANDLSAVCQKYKPVSETVPSDNGVCHCYVKGLIK